VSREVSLRGLVLVLVMVAVTGLSFLLFNRAFGGPAGRVGESRYEVTVVMDQTGQLLERSLVMVKGVPVGEVTKVDGTPQRTQVTLTVKPEYAPLREGAYIRLGTRTAFGEAYLRLDRGRPGGAELPSGSTIDNVDTVETDEALNVLGPQTRKNAASLLETVDRGIARGDDPERLRATVAEIRTTVREVRRLTRALDGQETELARLVEDGSTVVDALAQRDRQLRSIVTDGNTTMQALADRTGELEAGVTEASLTVAAADDVLTGLPGLLDDAEPAVADLAAAARELRPVIDQVGPTVRAAGGLVNSLPKLADAAVPALKEAEPDIAAVPGVSSWLVPALRNLIPMMDWLRPRAPDYAATFANVASVTNSGDSTGPFVRAFPALDPVEIVSRPTRCAPQDSGRWGNVCSNPFPEPGDALDPQPAKERPFPRLLPYPEP
jgi:phospholipid/cholesterol/gamma-HCH transport system substrate-binding protein